MHEELRERERQLVVCTARRRGRRARPREHGADREERDRRCGVGKQPDGLSDRPPQLEPHRRRHRAQHDRPRHRIGQDAAQGVAGGDRGAVGARAVQARQGDAHRRREEEVDQDGDDGRTGRAVAQQGHEERHAHVAGVGKGRDQRAEGSVVPADPPHARADRERHHGHRAQEVDADEAGVSELGDRRARPESIEHAR